MEPIYHTLQGPGDDNGQNDFVIDSKTSNNHNGNPPDVTGYSDGHRTTYDDATFLRHDSAKPTEYDDATFLRHDSEKPSEYDDATFLRHDSEKPTEYDPAHHDRLLWASPFEGYPLTSRSRDAYEIDDDDDLERIDPPKCGWGTFTPRCLQGCLSIKAYMVIFSMASLVQIMTSYGLVTIAITTIERRFELTSVQSGAIMSAYQFGTMAFTVIVTYIGENQHKPRWVGVGSLFLSVGSILFTLPHFLSGAYEYEEYESTDEGVCPFNNSTGAPGLDMCAMGNSSDGSGSEDPAEYFWLFIVAQIFSSLAAAPLFTLGVTFMDDNLSSKSFSLYMGIFNAVISFGPAAGFFIGVICLSLYTDFYADMSSITITPDNPLWIGAWWLGFLFSAVLIALIAFLIMGFPKTLPGMKQIQKRRRNQAQKGSEFVARSGFGNSLRDVPRAFGKVLCNVPFLCLCVTAITEYFVVSGMVVFSPKFLETQFNINSRDVGMYVGFIAMTTHFFGSLVSGVVMKRLDLHFPGLMKLCLIAAVASLLAGLGFIMHCPNAPIAGVTVQYVNTTVPYIGEEDGLLAECNSHCACAETYEPVCGDDNVMYYSPCHAGCTEEELIDGQMVYSNCRCIIMDQNQSLSYDVTSLNSYIVTSKNSYNVTSINSYNVTSIDSYTVTSIDSYNVTSIDSYNVTSINSYNVTSINSWDDPLIYGGAVPGRCQTNCSFKWFYLSLLWLFSFFGTVMAIPAWIGTMRCVSYSQRAFALGVQAVFYGGLGTAPAPIIFGLMIDDACIRWDSSGCDQQGACLVYDNKVFAHSLLILILAFKSVSVIFFSLALCCYKPSDEDETDADDVYGHTKKRVPTTEL